MCKKVVCFDLDDTLYKEVDFLKSGYRKVSELVGKRYGIDTSDVYHTLLSLYFLGENPFVRLNEKYDIDNSIEDYLNVYRYHQPSISLSDDTIATLNFLRDKDVILGIITDGRITTQNQKIEALGLREWFHIDNIYINEEPTHFKPNHWSFDQIMFRCFEQYQESNLTFYYVADNPRKDFLAPNQLKWGSICLLDDGRNIHKQEFNLLKEYLPKKRVNDIREIINII